MEEKNYTNPLDGLYEIVGDLWNKQKLQDAAAEAAKKAGVPAPAQAPAAAQGEPEPALPSFDQIWKTADETIDWTDILAGRNTMGLDPNGRRWLFLRSKAQSVLEGSLADYGSVLREVRPLDDMKRYARHIRVRAVSADEVQVSFEALKSDAESNGAAYKLYLCGIALRCARDLFAVLPVSSVHVSARDGDKEVLSVTFSRQDMRKTLFSFVDPVDFVSGLGATFAE